MVVTVASGNSVVTLISSITVPPGETAPLPLITASAEGERLVHDYELLKQARLEPVIGALGREKTDQLCDLLEEVCLGLLARDTVPQTTCLRCAGYYRAGCSVEKLQGECALRPRRRDGEHQVDEMEA